MFILLALSMLDISSDSNVQNIYTIVYMYNYENYHILLLWNIKVTRNREKIC